VFKYCNIKRERVGPAQQFSLNRLAGRRRERVGEPLVPDGLLVFWMRKLAGGVDYRHTGWDWVWHSGFSSINSRAIVGNGWVSP